MKRPSLLFIPLCLVALTVHAQEDLMKELEASTPKEVDYTTATFKGTRLINLHTVETLAKGSLDFRISHRFGDISSGANNFWGLDGPAALRLGLDYSLTDRLVMGVGRTNTKKMFDGFVKYKLLRQHNEGMPVTVTALTSINITSEKDPNKEVTGIDRYEYFSSRIAYFAQVMIARKFGQKFSAQFSPQFIHYNMVTATTDKNDMFSMSFSARYKVSRSIALTGEYCARLSRYSADFDNYHNVLGVGIDIETGGHVFQLFFTNASSINEVLFIPYTTSTWKNKEVRFGFNISRVFEFNRKKKSDW